MLNPKLPLVSVRLMVYNNEPYIREAIEGILIQKTDFNVEVVVGDDFSTDNTLQIIKSYNNTDNIHFNILKREIGGPYWEKRKELGRLYNFQNIIENCSGKYIALLDGDDYWTDPLKLQKQVDFLEKNKEFTACFHDTMCLNEEKSPELYKWRSYKRDVFFEEDTITKLSLFHTSSYLFRNKEIKLPDWFLTIASGDMALLGIISKRGKLKRLEGDMSVYRKHDNNITANEKIKTYHSNRIDLMSKLNSFFDSKYQEKADIVIGFHKDEIKKLLFGKPKNNLKKMFHKVNRIFRKNTP